MDGDGDFSECNLMSLIRFYKMLINFQNIYFVCYEMLRLEKLNMDTRPENR